MEDPQTWQELLQSITSDPLEQQKIARKIGVNPITLNRWVNKISIPRLANLRPLVEAMPKQKQRAMLVLIQKDFPNFSLEGVPEEPIMQEIPSAFYSSIINIYTTSPPILRPSTICIAIFQQMLRHLDPLKQGLLILACQCVPANPGKKVRSLRSSIGRATLPWESMDDYMAFMGLESQVGDAVTKGHAIITQTEKEHGQLYTTHKIPFSESIAVFPLLSFDKVAGAISIVSTQAHHFTPAYTELMQSYIELLILAFEPEDFYSLKEINLGIMPPGQIQEPYLGTFHKEVTKMMLESKPECPQMKRANAEKAVWKKLEEQLLLLHHF